MGYYAYLISNERENTSGKGKLAYLKALSWSCLTLSSIKLLLKEADLAAVQTKGLPSQNKLLNTEISW